ncbi:MAG: hypothetical protein ACTH32_06480 [Microbacterium gubbeenense]|uniref:hypothetical protein n=1 Tax=Microbacterium gubbeenense TaxID=159896 RepID=UPI003F9678CE
MDKEELDDLRSLADEATQGRWDAAVGEYVIYSGYDKIATYVRGKDGRYIALASPRNVKFLLDRIDQLEASIDMAMPRLADSAYYLLKSREGEEHDQQ